MRQSGVRTVLAGLQSARQQGLLGGPLNGVTPPKIITNQLYLPTGYALVGTTHSTAVNARYYSPYFCYQTKTFTGMKTYNSGAGDNGETLRLGIYADDGAAGGPGTLVIDAGEITLTGASAVRTLASAFTLIAGRWYWFCSAHNTAAAFWGMSPHYYQTAAGTPPVSMVSASFGYRLSAAPTATVMANAGVGLFVSTAYGALPSTAVAATSEVSVNASSSVGNAEGTIPLVGIYE